MKTTYTKALRENEEKDRIAELQVQYFPRLMRVLDVATHAGNMECLVNSDTNTFLLVQRDTHEKFALSFYYEHGAWVLENLEDFLVSKADAEAKAKIKYQKRVDALNKLTPEDRKVLGL